MILTVKRIQKLDSCTIGKLFIDSQDAGIFTLEPKVRDVKVDGCTAIPEGNYNVCVDFSNHFQRELPHILNVPNFEGVRIHPGNTDKDTEGCILLGLEWNGGDFIGRSREAFERVFDLIKAAPSTVVEIVTA